MWTMLGFFDDFSAAPAGAAMRGSTSIAAASSGRPARTSLFFMALP